MNEHDIKRGLKKLICFFICMAFLLMAAGYAVVHVFISTFSAATEERMQEESDNYKGRIERQINQNFQFLNSISSIIGNYGLENTKNFSKALQEANKESNFLMLGFFDQEGEGILSSINRDQAMTIRLSDTQQEIQNSVLRSLQGEQVLTDTFIGELSKKKVLAFSVPVYENDRIVGTLIASDSVEAFSTVLDERNMFYGSGYVHLVDSEGNYLITGEEMAVKDAPLSVLEPPYMNEQKAWEARESMEKGEMVEFTFSYAGKEYHGLLDPLEVNGWYLFCVNSIGNVNRNIYLIAYTVMIFFALIMALFIFTLYSVYRLMKSMNGQLKKMAYYDDLTGIYNIKQFTNLAEAEHREKKKYAIAVFNVRQFKFVNEIFGKEQADKLLKYIGKILEQAIKAEEFVCRESADSFYVFFKETNPFQILARIDKIIKKITDIGELADNSYQLVIRCGVAMSEKGKDVQSVMTCAMFALARAKEENKDVWFFDSALHEKEQIENFIENNAREALKNNEFQLFLQPKINLKDGSLSGAEALVRWIRNDGMVLYPNSFIPMFEKNGFCVQLDMYMFEKACSQIREWIDKGYEPIPISINQSRMTFYEGNYEIRLYNCLQKYRIPASLITLEILEGIILENVETLNNRLEKLQKIGFQISMDDFGTGYSSLNALGKLKINEVKLDRGFLLEASEEANENTRLIMEEIIHLSKKLRISTVIEGIETKQDEEFVKKIGCDNGQGYLYSKPISAKSFTEEILKKHVKKNQDLS